MKYPSYKNIVLFFLLNLISVITLFAGQVSDSLKRELVMAKDMKKIELQKTLADALLQEGDVVQSEIYYIKAMRGADEFNDLAFKSEVLHSLGRLYSGKLQFDTAIHTFKNAVDIRIAIGDYEGANKSLVNIASNFIFKTEGDSAIFYADSAIKAAEIAGYDRGLAFAYNQKGSAYHYKGVYEKSVKYYQEALRIFESIDFLPGVASCVNNIGLDLQNIAKHDESLEYFKRALQIATQQNNYEGIARAYSNIGSYFYSILKEDEHRNNEILDSAIIDSTKYYYQLSYENFKKAGNQMGMASSINNLGLAYSTAGEYKLANKYLTEAHQYWVGTDNKYELSRILLITGLNYNEIGEYQKAIDVLDECSVVAESADLLETFMMSYRYKTRAYDSLRNYKMALSCLYNYVKWQDTLRNEKTDKVVEELKTVYETEKKEQEISNQKKINDKQLLINEQQKRLLIFSIVGAIIVMLVLVLMIVQYIQKRKANNLLVLQNEEILFQKKEIEMQRDEIEAQRNQVVKQRDLIAEQQNNIMDSIHYASRIQEAILPPDDFLDKYLENDYFVLFKPRDIVSGDFYWFGRKNKKSIVVAADCTGHGVPGAFMSMLGTAFLNEISANVEDLEAHTILNKLREYVIKSLKQTGKEGEQKDGMDLSLYIYDKENRSIQFAGANNPLLIIRPFNGNEVVSDNPRISAQIVEQKETGKQFQIIQFKADKMPIGIYAENRPFESVNFDIEIGDALYTFSDGYQDQFGGVKNKKFMIKNLKQLLVDNYNLPMKEQHFVLDSTIEDWKNSSAEPEQVDDILVIGYKILK